MKKTFKILLFILSIFTFINIVNADASDCDGLTSAKAKEACKQIDKLCETENGGNLTGCKYNENDDKYNKIRQFSVCYGFNCMTVKDVKLSRGYMAADKDGKVYFAGCYKVQYEGNSNAGGDRTKRFGPSTYYAFKILEPPYCYDIPKGNDGTAYAMVPPENIAGYNGRNAVGGGDRMTFKGWKAVDGGECPLVFGLTGNARGFTSDKNKFVFADDESDLDLDMKSSWFAFWTWGSREYYVTNAGCTVQDEAGMREAVKCYDDAIKAITSKPCPADISNYDVFKAELEGLAKKCDNKFSVFYSYDLLKSNAETFKSTLTQAVNAKLNSCQFGNCNLTATEQKALDEKIAASQYKYGCASLTGTAYDACYNYMMGLYESSGLSADKIKCLKESQKKRDEAQQQLEQIVEQEQEQHVQDELDENRQRRAGLINGYIPQLPDMPEVPGPTTCSNLLGPNLVKVVKAAIRIIQIVGAIIAIVKGMMILIPPILSKDSDALKKASSTLVTMAIILVIIFLFPTILRVIGSVLGFDLSCI